MQITKAHATAKVHRSELKIAATTITEARRKPISRAVGGEGTRMDEEGSRANQWIDAARIPIKKPSPRPKTSPSPFHTALTASDANPNGTITAVSSTAGMFATGAIKETRRRS